MTNRVVNHESLDCELLQSGQRLTCDYLAQPACALYHIAPVEAAE